jgi:hypothetical protein
VRASDHPSLRPFNFSNFSDSRIAKGKGSHDILVVFVDGFLIVLLGVFLILLPVVSDVVPSYEHE